MWSITVEVSSLTVFHSKFTCAGLWTTELDGRMWFEAAGGSWEFHIIRSICSLMKTCKCEMQFQLKGLEQRLPPLQSFDLISTPPQSLQISSWARLTLLAAEQMTLPEMFTFDECKYFNENLIRKPRKNCVSQTSDDCKHLNEKCHKKANKKVVFHEHLMIVNILHFIEKCHKKANKHFLRFTNSSHLVVTLSLHSIFGGSWLLVRGQRLE